MNIQQLEYIVALDCHRHFFKAAEACCITQATLSGMIKKLEQELNVILFDRSKQPVQPTEIGKKVIEQAKVALQETNKIRELVIENTVEITGELRIGIIPSLAPYLLPLFLKDFMGHHNQVKLIINEMTTKKIKENLKEGHIDVAILAIPLLDKELKEETLFYEEFFHYGHLKSDSTTKKFINPEDINTNKLLLMEEGHCLRNQVVNICQLREKNDVKVKLEYQSGSIETLKQMVDLDMGSTILPGLSILTLNEMQRTKLSTFVSPFPVREIGLVYYRHFTKKRTIEALRSSILRTIPETMLLKKNMCVIPVKQNTMFT